MTLSLAPRRYCVKYIVTRMARGEAFVSRKVIRKPKEDPIPTIREQADYWTGQAVLAIGRGEQLWKPRCEKFESS